MNAISFTVFGQAKPAGSKRGFLVKTKAGPKVVLSDANKNSRPWKQEVASAAQAMYSGPLLEGPLLLQVDVFSVRPRGHFGKRGVKESAPLYPATRPDVLKLARGIEDALSGLIYRDDAQIVDEILHKRYGEPARCEITVELLPERIPGT